MAYTPEEIEKTLDRIIEITKPKIVYENTSLNELQEYTKLIEDYQKNK